MNKSARETNDAGQPMLYTLHPPGHIFTDFEDIRRFDAEFWEVTKGMPIRTGSLMRLRSDALAAWRIGLTEETRGKIKETHDQFRIKDYKEKARDSAIESMEVTNWTTMTRNSMVRVMVHFSKEVLTAVDDGKRTFNVCELACGYGKVSVSLAASLLAQGFNDLLARMKFILVDYSYDKLIRARDKLAQYKPGSIAMESRNDEEFLAGTGERMDLILSLCHMHKKPFLGDLLGNAQAALSRKGAIVSGDWHSSLSNHPHQIYDLLVRLGADRRRLQLFQDMFKGFWSPPADLLSGEELRAVLDHKEYWVSVNREIHSSTSAKDVESRHYVLGAFDTTEQRVRLMEESGLIVDHARIQKAFPQAKIHSNPIQMSAGSDRATVMMALKGRLTRQG